MSCSSAPVTATSRSTPPKVARDRRDALGDGEAVLEQAVPVGLVVALGGRRLAERSHVSVPGPNTQSSSARRWRHWIVAISSRRSASIRSTGIRGPSSRSSSAYSSGSAARSEPHVQAPARLDAARDPHARAGLRPRRRVAQSASSVPVRSPRRVARRRRAARATRTIRTWSISWPGVRSRTRTRRNPRSSDRTGRLRCTAMPERTALVTGGAGGLGRSVVDALLGDGWRVVVPVRGRARTSTSARA